MVHETDHHLAPPLVADERAQHVEQFGALQIRGAVVERSGVADLASKDGRADGDLLGELQSAQVEHVEHTCGRTEQVPPEPVLCGEDGEPFLQRQLTPCAHRDPVATHVVPVLVRHVGGDEQQIVVRVPGLIGDEQRRLEEHQAVVLGGIGVARDGHVEQFAEIVLDTALLFIEAHHLVHRPQCELAAVDHVRRRDHRGGDHGAGLCDVLR